MQLVAAAPVRRIFAMRLLAGWGPSFDLLFGPVQGGVTSMSASRLSSMPRAPLPRYEPIEQSLS